MRKNSEKSVSSYPAPEYDITVDDDRCIRCGRCVAVCPSQIFRRAEAGLTASGSGSGAGVSAAGGAAGLAERSGRDSVQSAAIPELRRSESVSGADVRGAGVPDEAGSSGARKRAAGETVLSACDRERGGFRADAAETEGGEVPGGTTVPDMRNGTRRPAVETCRPDCCILCGHCVAACPVGAVRHSGFPLGTVHPVDASALPTPEQVSLLMASRRSNRAFAARPVPRELLDRIVAAADLAPTASNARKLGYTLATRPETLRRIAEFTLGVFGRVVRLLGNPLVRPWLRPLMPDAYRYLPVFEKMRRDYAAGEDRILRGAPAVLFIHAPRSGRFGAEDANLACQNASLMAEALGVSQVYMGFVLTAVRQRPGKLERLLGLAPQRRICAAIALGMPLFRFPNYVDRAPSPVGER